MESEKDNKPEINPNMSLCINDVKQKQISEREIKLLEKGFEMGEFKFKSREELYEIFRG